MSLRPFAFVTLLASTLPALGLAQTATSAPPRLELELNGVQDVGTACRLTFLVQNETGAAIDQSVFETVVFDTSGNVVTLSLFDFRELPAERPRVRQFELPGMACDSLGQVLINGAHSCLVAASESKICDQALSLSSRHRVELLG